MSYRIDEIAERYRNMDDGELLELASQKDQLTPEACAALENEMANRRLKDEPQNAPLEAGYGEENPDAAPESDNYLKEGLFDRQKPTEIMPSDYVPIFYAATEAEAKSLQESLIGEGIDCQMQIVLCVAKANEEAADKIVSAKLNEMGMN